jgi:hypothetical protein
MKLSERYCPICGGQVFSRHKNPGGWCDPCWLEDQEDDVELQSWGMGHETIEQRHGEMLRAV